MREETWRIIDSLVKGIGASAIAGVIAFYGYEVQTQRELVVQRTERVTAAVEMAAKQKDLDVGTITQVLDSLLSRFAVDGSGSEAGPVERDDLLFLRMVALNFVDVPINLKPIFEDIDARLDARRDGETKRELREIAREAANRQALRMTYIGGHDLGKKEVKAGASITLRNLGLAIEVREVTEDEIAVTVSNANENGREIARFGVGYFDMPIVDNIKIEDSTRVAFLRSKTDDGQPALRVVSFQADLASDRFDVKELSRLFINLTPGD